MRKIILFVMALTHLEVFCQQSNQIQLSDLKTPNSPGFQILDLSPTSIEKPTSPKEFALGLFNASNNGSIVPKNFAFEVAPYWYFKPSNANVYKYLNISDSVVYKNKKTNVDQVINRLYAFQGIWNKLSLSLASSYCDSTSGSLLKNTNYISFGARTNLMTLRSMNQNKNLKLALSNVVNRGQAIAENIHSQRIALEYKLKLLTDSMKRIIDTSLVYKNLQADSQAVSSNIKSLNDSAANLLENAKKNDKMYKSFIDRFTQLNNRPPVFQIDVAYAYSKAFANNSYSNARFNRSALWLNASLSICSFRRDTSDNLSLILMFKIMGDNVLADTAKSIFQRENSNDNGAKLDYSIGRFSISFEYIRRNYKDYSSLNSTRAVGVLQYKVSDNLYISGTFGQNFGNFNNLFTLLGLNWGFGGSPLSVD